jgi:hypothetical protein
MHDLECTFEALDIYDPEFSPSLLAESIASTGRPHVPFFGKRCVIHIWLSGQVQYIDGLDDESPVRLIAENSPHVYDVADCFCEWLVKKIEGAIP